VYFYQEGQDWQANGVAAAGQQVVYPERTTAYVLRVLKDDGAEAIRTITIDVQANAGPSIESFAVVPNGAVPAGACVDISWRVIGEDVALQLTRDDAVLWEVAPSEGNLQDCPPKIGEFVYTLTATDANGGDTRQQTVKVVAAAANPASSNTAPVIDAFAVSPEAVAVNGCVAISWNVGGDVKLIQILRDDAVILDDAETSGSGQNCLTDAGVYRFRLVATGSTGEESRAEVAVTVAPPTPVAPSVTGPSDPALTGKTWALISLFDGVSATRAPLAGSQIIAEFGDDGLLAGSAGCNNYSSGYTASDGVMKISPAVATFKFCGEPAGVMDQEAIYLALLTTVSTYVIEDGQLTLADGSGQSLAIFAAEQ
jgi:heat shock protein HslJ